MKEVEIIQMLLVITYNDQFFENPFIKTSPQTSKLTKPISSTFNHHFLVRDKITIDVPMHITNRIIEIISTTIQVVVRVVEKIQLNPMITLFFLHGNLDINLTKLNPVHHIL